MSVMTLVSCEEDILTELNESLSQVEGLDKTVPLEKVTLDLYIITDETTEENAMKTVNDKINQHLKDRKNKKFDTTLKIHYIKVTEDSSYLEQLEGKTSGIVLIDGKDTLDALVSANRLANLEHKDLIYEDNTFKFAQLNLAVGKDLLEMARETVTVSDTEKYKQLNFIPNNHVIGSYKYITFKESIATALYWGEDEIRKITSVDSTKYEDLMYDFYEAYPEGNWEDFVQVREDQPYYMADKYEEDGYYCNILEKPVLNKEEAARAGFAILKDPSVVDTQAFYDSKTEESKKHKSYVQSALEFILALNTDSTLRNYLQYGIENTNYTVKDGKVVPIDPTKPEYADLEDSVYKMNIEYTGSVFLAKFCDTYKGEWEWTAELKSSGEDQNKDVIIAK